MQRAVVIGAGAMGAPAARVLAERGWHVTLVEQFEIANQLGGSGHESRSFRLSHNDRADVRLAISALELWNDLERRSGETLLIRRGIVQRGSVATTMGAALAAEGVQLDELDHLQVQTLFPELRAMPEQPAIFQPDGAVLRQAHATLTQVKLAVAAGAVVHTNEKVVAVNLVGDGARVFTKRRRLDADIVVVCAGPWSLPLLRPVGIDIPLNAGIVQVNFFASRHEGWENRPGLMERTTGPGIYGMPEHGRGYKLGLTETNPSLFWKSGRVRQLDRGAEETLIERVREDFTGLDPTSLAVESGPITVTPDETFVIDRRGPIVVGAGCTGHAAKFSPVLGELFADLAEGKPLREEAHRFRLDRPGLVSQGQRGSVHIGA